MRSLFRPACLLPTVKVTLGFIIIDTVAIASTITVTVTSLFLLFPHYYNWCRQVHSQLVGATKYKIANWRACYARRILLKSS